MITTKNKDGDWVPAIPKPLYVLFGFKKECVHCRISFWTEKGFRGHYALVHIMKLN